MDNEEKTKQDTKFLEWGFKAAITVAFLGIIFSACYLFYFMFKSNPEIIKQDIMTGFSAERRMCLLSTGIFVAMSFGFLGFALFLIQAKGEVEGKFEYSNFSINISRMSPGLFVILCATVIIIVCETFRIEYSQPAQLKIPNAQTVDSTESKIRDLPDPDETIVNDSSKIR